MTGVRDGRGAGAEQSDFQRWIGVLNRRRLILLVTVASVVAATVVLTLQQTPRYAAEAELLLRGSEAELRLDANVLDILGTGRSRVETEMGLIESRSVEDAVRDELGRDPDVTASAKGGSDIVVLRAESDVPELATEAANVYAETYLQLRREQSIGSLLDAQRTVQDEIDSLAEDLQRVEAPLRELERQLFGASEDEQPFIRGQIDELEGRIAPERDSLTGQIALVRSQLSQLEVAQNITSTGGAQIVSRAVVPDDPFEPRPVRNLVVAVLLGIMLGIGLAFARELLDDRFPSKEHLERESGWRAIGIVPSWQRSGTRPADGPERALAAVEDPRSPAAEAYRALRTALEFLALEGQLSPLMVTSPQQGDGKTTTAANLAVAFANAGKRVLLVDADLRRPDLHNRFAVPGDVGFTSVLRGTIGIDQALQATGIGSLVVLPAGEPAPNPSELLGLPAAAELVARLERHCDLLIFDSPPLLPVTDPIVLSRLAKGVVVVTDARRGRRGDVLRAAEILQYASARVLGCVVNNARAVSTYGYGEPNEPQNQPTASAAPSP